MNRTVLVVDDEPAIVFMLRMALEERGYDAVAATSGEEAIAALERDDPRAVLLDIRLPGIDGWGVLEHIGADRLGELPVIVISAHVSGHSARRAMSMGARRFVGKPFDPDEVVDQLREVLGD